MTKPPGVEAAGPSPAVAIEGGGGARYVLYEAFASGGMATVHFARQHGHQRFARTVAIKRLRPNFAADPWHLSMFLDEARVGSRIRHPNVVPTLDVVRTESEVLIVMEYVAGESLAALVRRRGEAPHQVPPTVAAAVLVDVLHGLHAAHETRDELGGLLGIVHRDVSPHNVLVDLTGAAHLIDFGVAKARGSIHETRAGHVKGKVAYMPREQLLGQPLDRRSDLFAASVVLWESLTGRRFFTEGGPSRVLRTGFAEPPSRYAEGVSKELDAIVARGLEPSAARRYPTARAMALAIEASVPLAARSQVADWALRLAGPRLEARAEAVAAIERRDFLDRQRPLDEGVAARALDDTRRERRPDPSVGAAGASKATLRRAPWTMTVAAGAALLLVLAASLGALRSGALKGCARATSASGQRSERLPRASPMEGDAWFPPPRLDAAPTAPRDEAKAPALPRHLAPAAPSRSRIDVF